MAESVATTSNSMNITSDVPIVLKKPSAKLLSPVKAYFSQKTIDNKFVICSICKSEFSINTATATISKQSLTMAQKTKFNMLVADNIELPSRDVIKSIVQKAFAIMQKDIKSLFEQISSKISIILDIWTSRANVPFICIMAHWIDSDWSLKKILLNICMLPHPHMGDEIDTKLCSVFVAFNITDKVLCATTDRGSNIISAILLSIKSSIEKVCNFVNIVSLSSSLTQDFKELRQSVGNSEATCKISQDVLTHWNSTYFMLSTYITMPTTILAIIRRNKKLEKFKLTPQEETNLQAAAQFLKPFYETTNVLSGSTYMTLGTLILLINNIVKNISLCIQNLESPEFLKTAATQMSKKIQKYANKIYDKMAFIATILDPQIKLKLIPVDMNTKVNRTIFNNIFRTEYAELVLNNFSTYLTSSTTHTSSPSSIFVTSSTSLTSSTSSISSISPTSPTNLK
ncbi:9319_t:CDS:2 [Gigaspora margarita]|uniref:9319_t:CDS:1 n=1 Tax=Gigaspora margarita TaxID=4874 RepID=A0ABN7VID3_GIGMA|nr:9319_t:CDS:2 [Gigaspora margarita]